MKVLVIMLAITLNRSFGALTDAIRRNRMVFACDKLGIVRQCSSLEHLGTTAIRGAAHLLGRRFRA
jgi:hypothetical protein